MLQLYDSFTQTKRPFQPLVPGKIGLYVCGITVYDYCHIGHARVFVAFDVMCRYFASQGHAVTYVRNITDVDDKIIQRAQALGVSVEHLTAQYIEAMWEDMGALGILPPTLEPRATESIPLMLALIQRLMDKGVAYVGAEGDVYYAVDQYPAYGALSHQKMDALQSGIRVATATDKHSPLDFVLWKRAKPTEGLAWPSPWGDGRPGWHIECSAMSMDCLGETFDIHGGGHDLVFPHHENERAQSEAATGHLFANTWMHVGFVQVDNQKMSKSLGNFFTIRDVLKTNDPEAVRYFLLASHYRTQISYSLEGLRAAQEALQRLYGALRGLAVVPAPEMHPAQVSFEAAMNDDFNTPVALGVFFELSHAIHRHRVANDLEEAKALAAVLRALAGVLGLLTRDPEQYFQAALPEGWTVAQIEAKIVARNAARAGKNWAKADILRKELEAVGIILEDKGEETLWRKA